MESSRIGDSGSSSGREPLDHPRKEARQSTRDSSFTFQLTTPEQNGKSSLSTFCPTLENVNNNGAKAAKQTSVAIEHDQEDMEAEEGRNVGSAAIKFSTLSGEKDATDDAVLDVPGGTTPLPGNGLASSAATRSKRPSMDDNAFQPPSSKKVKPASERNRPTDESNLEETSKMKKMVKCLTREEMEEMVCRSVAEVMTGRSELSRLRQRTIDNEAIIMTWKTKAGSLQKQVQDLTLVVTKCIADMETRPATHRVAPVKITRSVGLQVSLSTVTSGPSHTKNTLCQGIIPPKSDFPNGFRLGKMMPPPPPSSSTVSRLSRPASSSTSTSSQSSTTSSLPPSTTLNLASNGKRLNSAHLSWTNDKLHEVIDLTDLPEDKDCKSSCDLRSVRTVSVNPGQTSHGQGYVDNTKQMLGTISITPCRRKSVSNQVSSQEPNSSKVSTLIRTDNLLGNPNMTIGGRQDTLQASQSSGLKHPAPLPSLPDSQLNLPSTSKQVIPKPCLKIFRARMQVMLSWNMTMASASEVKSYEIFAYKEPNSPPSVDLWKNVGEVKAQPLPMVCTINKMASGTRMFFAVRSIGVDGRLGAFSDPQGILLP